MIPGSYYPRSFTILVIVAMSVLTVPLASGLINAVHALDRVADAQRQFTRNSLAITRDVRYVAGSVSQLQRASGQYHLLQDAEFGPPLATRFGELETRMARVAERLPDAESRAALDSLQRHVAALYRQVRPGRFLDSASFNALAPAFDTLHADARALVNRADAGVQHELVALEATVHDTRRRLIVLALALIPLTLLLAGVFSWMISRPIKQLRGAIQQLGQGDLRPAARINGPQDIVELGRELDWLRQRLEALEAQKLRFLRHVSHELKTPLASLREGVALLGDELAGTLNARQRTIVGIMDSGSRVLQRRIEDLIRYGGMARAPLHPAEGLPLGDVVGRVVDAQRLALDARRIEVESQLDAASIRADRSHVETVLDNLLSNAVKFSPDDGRILIRSEPAGDAVAVWVCDQGPGIAPADRERIFEPFFQGADQPATTVKGSGLGLSIVREAVLAANGSVEIVERAPWATCFRVTWPSPQ
jgi:two-component system sensor histidine kinase GlrK